MHFSMIFLTSYKYFAFFSSPPSPHPTHHNPCTLQPLLDNEWSGEPLGYHIFWKEAYVAMPETMYALDNPYLSEYILGSLEEWTEYSIRMRAYNERGEGPISAAVIERTSDTGMNM